MTKKKNPLSSLQSAATGMAGLGLTVGVGSAISSRATHIAGPGSPNLGGSFNTLAGFAPIAVTGLGAKAALDSTKRLRKKKHMRY